MVITCEPFVLPLSYDKTMNLHYMITWMQYFCYIGQQRSGHYCSFHPIKNIISLKIYSKC